MEQRSLDEVLRRVQGDDSAEAVAEPSGVDHDSNVQDQLQDVEEGNGGEPRPEQAPANPWNVSVDDRAANDSLYQEPTVVFEDDNVKAVIQKTHLKRQKVFSVSDHLYVAKIIPKFNKPEKKSPFLLNLLSVFKQIIIAIIVSLRDFYEQNLTDDERLDPEKYHQQVYTTLTGDTLSRGLNAGNYSLRSDPATIAYAICGQMLNYLQSHEELRLDNSWQLYFRVLSVEHLRFRKYQKNNILQHVGANPQVIADPQNRRTHYIFRAPVGFLPSHPYCFKNKCFVISLILGVIYANGLIFPGLQYCDWHVASQIHSDDSILRVQAGRKLLHILVSTLREIGFNNLQFDNVLLMGPKLSQLFNCQIVIYSEINNKIMYMFPSQWDPTKILVNLLYSRPNGNSNAMVNGTVGHIDLLLNLKTYQRRQGSFQFPCCRKSQSKFLTHFCLKFFSCYKCKRIKRGDNYFVDPNLPNLHCDSSICPNTPFSCRSCRVVFDTVDCFAQHFKSKLCKSRAFCTKCCKYVFTSSTFKTLKEAILKHKCFSRFCRACKVYSDENEEHVCKLKETQSPLPWSNLMMLTVEFDPYLANGRTLFSPAMCHIFFEQKQKEMFSELTFTPFIHESRTEEQIVKTYYPESMASFSRDLVQYQPRRRYGNPYSQRSVEKMVDLATLNCCDSLNPLIHFLKWLISPKMTSYSILCKDDTTLELVLEAILKLGIIPETIRSRHRLHSVTLTPLNTTFLSRASYIQGNDRDMLKSFPSNTLTPSYFPYNCLLPDQYVGSIPHEKSYEHFLNYENDFTVIKDWIKIQSDTLWKKEEERRKHLLTKSLILLHVMVEFKKLSLQIQEHCSKETRKSDGHTPYFSPFTYPITSISALSFRMFKHFFLNQPIYTIPGEHKNNHRNSSRPEMEYVLWKTYSLQAQEENTYSSFSRLGQKVFKYLIPDLYIFNVTGSTKDEQHQFFFLQGCNGKESRFCKASMIRIFW